MTETKRTILFVIESIEKIYKIFRPKYHNYLAWVVVLGGLSITAGPLWEPYLREFIKKYLEVAVPDPPNSWVGSAIVCFGLVYHFFAFRLESIKEIISKKGILEHDAIVFQKFRSLVSDSQVDSFCSWLLQDHSYRLSENRRFYSIIEFLYSPEHTFLDQEIAFSANAICAALQELQDFLSIRFFVYPDSQASEDIRLCMQPDQNMDRGGTGASEEVKLYDNWTNELEELTGNFKHSYDQFIKTVHIRLGSAAFEI